LGKFGFEKSLRCGTPQGKENWGEEIVLSVCTQMGKKPFPLATECYFLTLTAAVAGL